jgi:hypothetical protein
MRSRPLRTLAFLTQSPRNAVTMTPIVSADAAFRLLGCFLSFAADRATIARNVALAIQLASEVRSVEARLTKKVAAPAMFRELAPHLGPEVTRKVPPANLRELISEFRSFLRKHGSYTFENGKRARVAGAMPIDGIVVRSATDSDLAPGDIGLYWRPGRTADDDTLVCHPADASMRSGKSAVGVGRPEALGKLELGVAAAKGRQAAKRIGDPVGWFDPLVVLLGPRARRTT